MAGLLRKLSFVQALERGEFVAPTE
jgi:hypothetical protein